MFAGIFYIVIGVGLGILMFLLSAGRIPQSSDPVKNAELVVANKKLFVACGIMMMLAGVVRGIMTMVDASGS